VADAKGILAPFVRLQRQTKHTTLEPISSWHRGLRLSGRSKRHPRPLCPPAKANDAHNLGAHFLMAQRSAPEWQKQKASSPPLSACKGKRRTQPWEPISSWHRGLRLSGRCKRHPRPLCPPAKANKAHNLGAHFLMAQRSAPEWQMQKASLPLICKTNSAPNIYSHQNTAMYSSHEWRIKRASPFVCLCEPAHMIAYTHARALLHSHINAHTRIHTHLTYAEPRNNQ